MALMGVVDSHSAVGSLLLVNFLFLFSFSRLQDEMLQREEAENTLQSFRQVCDFFFPSKLWEVIRIVEGAHWKQNWKGHLVAGNILILN